MGRCHICRRLIISCLCGDMCKSCARREELETENDMSAKGYQLQFDQVVPEQIGHDVRVVVIDDTYHSNVNGNDETCDDGDTEMEHVEASNQTIVGDIKLGSNGGEMAGEQSKEIFKQLDEEADNHLDSVQQFDQVVPEQSENNVRVVIIDDTYHSSVDGNDETCDNGDIEKEQIGVSNQTIVVGDSKCDSDGDQMEMAGEQSLEIFKQPLEEANNHFDCERNWHAAKSDFACDKSSKDMAKLFTNNSVELEWMLVPNIQQSSATDLNSGANKEQSLDSEIMLLPTEGNTCKSVDVGSSSNDTNSMLPIKNNYLYVPPDDITTRVQRLGITLKELFVCANSIIGVVLMQSLKESINVMVRWSNDDWATYHDTQADLITTGAHDEMELFQFNISAEKTLHIRFALYYCTIHDGSRTFWDNNYGQNYNFEVSK